jgi:hypothetical protein
MRAFACPVCNNFTPFEEHRCPNCQATVGLHLPTKTMVLSAEKVRFAAARDIVALESYADVPVERLLFDWKWMSLFFKIAKLGFVHRVVREPAKEPVG